MKFDLSGKSVEELEARQLELKDLPDETRDAMSTEELEERCDEIEAIKAELEAREKAAKEAEEIRQEVAESRLDPVIKEFKMEEKKMNFEVSSPEYRDAFLKNLMGKELTAEERTAVTATAAIPTQTMNQIIGKLEQNPLLAAIDITNIPGYVTYPAESNVMDANWVEMGTAATDSTDAITSITLGAYKLIKTVEITADVDAMSIDAFETWLVARLVNKIEKAIDYAVLNGAGSGSNQATGIITTKTTEDGTFTRGGMTWAQLCEIAGKLPGQYHQDAKFVFNPEFFFGKIMGMVDSSKNRVVVLDPQGAVKYNVLGYPAIIDGNLSSEEVLFGDLSAYKFNFAKGIEVKKSAEAEFRKGSQVYRAMCLADGKLGDVNAIVRYIATT